MKKLKQKKISTLHKARKKHHTANSKWNDSFYVDMSSLYTHWVVVQIVYCASIKFHCHGWKLRHQTRQWTVWINEYTISNLVMLWFCSTPSKRHAYTTHILWSISVCVDIVTSKCSMKRWVPFLPPYFGGKNLVMNFRFLIFFFLVELCAAFCV